MVLFGLRRPWSPTGPAIDDRDGKLGARQVKTDYFAPSRRDSVVAVVRDVSRWIHRKALDGYNCQSRRRFALLRVRWASFNRFTCILGIGFGNFPLIFAQARLLQQLDV